MAIDTAPEVWSKNVQFVKYVIFAKLLHLTNSSLRHKVKENFFYNLCCGTSKLVQIQKKIRFSNIREGSGTNDVQ